MVKLKFLTWVLLAALMQAMVTTAAESDGQINILPDDDGPWVVKAHYDDWERVRMIRVFKSPWGIDRKNKVMILEVRSAEEFQALIDFGLELTIDEARTTTYFRTPLRSSEGLDTIPGFPCYSTVEHSYQRMDDLAAARPDLVQILDIGDSWEKINLLGAGYDIRVARITNQAIGGDKPILFAMGSIHAREYTPAELVARFAEMLVNGYESDADINWMLDHHEVHLVFQGNPDGRKRAETGLSWRKTTNQAYCGASSNSRGADMNRNFQFKWGGVGASSSECSNIYRGPSSQSESETQAINNYVTSIFSDQRGPLDSDAAPDDTSGVYLDIHSFSEVVIWPWGWGAPTVAPNHDQLQTLGRRLAWFNDYTPMQADDFGPASGASDDNAYGQLGVATYTFELGTNFFQACSTFENTILPDNLDALMYALRVARTPYITASGPDILTPQLSSSVVDIDDNSPVIITGNSTDDRFNNNNGTEPTQNISGVEYFIDIPPWEPGATSQPLIASDGNFDSTSEGFEGTIDRTGLTQGRHTIYIRATDASGTDGPAYALFLEITGPIFSDGFE